MTISEAFQVSDKVRRAAWGPEHWLTWSMGLLVWGNGEICLIIKPDLDANDWEPIL